MTKKELYDWLNAKYDFSTTEEWDPSGYDPKQSVEEEVTGVLSCLDLDLKTIQMAIDNHLNVIISLHPLLLHPAPGTGISASPENKKLFKMLQEHNILHISIHTVFCKYKYGTSYLLAKKLPKVKEIVPVEFDGSIVDVTLEEPVILGEWLQEIADSHYFSIVKFVKEQANKMISRFALCSGSGSSAFNKLYKTKLYDCYLTGDVRWHKYLDGNLQDFPIVDIGHDSEKIFCDAIADDMKELGIKVMIQYLTITLVDLVKNN